MSTFNRISILGVLGSDPEVKQTKNGKPYTRLSLSTHRKFRDESGVMRTETTWHKVMLWNKLAEHCANHCEKGQALYIDGYLTSYTKSDGGVTTYHTGIVGEQVRYIPGTRAALSAEAGEQEEYRPTPTRFERSETPTQYN